MKPKLITNFNRLNEIEYQTLVSLIIAALTGNLRFPLPWPAPAPSLEQLIAAFDAYCSAYRAALGGDSALIAARNAARETLTGLLQQLAAYLEFAAHGDVAALQSTGFDLRRAAVRLNSSEPLPAPEGLKLRHGAFSGERSQPGARPAMVWRRVTQGCMVRCFQLGGLLLLAVVAQVEARKRRCETQAC